MENEGVAKVERYRSGGTISGVVGMAAVILLLVWGLVSNNDGMSPWAFPALVLGGVLVWAILLRPSIALHADELELRNVLHRRFVPFARITSIRIDQMTVVEVDEARYVGSGFGRSRLTINRDAKAGPDAPAEQHSVGWLVEEKIRRRMRPHDAVADVGEVRREWAWPEIGALAVLALATLVTALVA